MSLDQYLDVLYHSTLPPVAPNLEYNVPYNIAISLSSNKVPMKWKHHIFP